MDGKKQMKIIKVILGVIIALSVVFFATGLVVKETTYTASVEINKPITEVFKAFEDKEVLKQWLPEIQSITPIEEKAEKIGSTYEVIIKNKEDKLMMKETILAYVANEKITFQFDSKDMLKIDDYNFIANGNTTKIVQNSSIQSNSYIMGCVFPYFKGNLKTISQNYMERFKALVEK